MQKSNAPTRPSAQLSFANVLGSPEARGDNVELFRLFAPASARERHRFQHREDSENPYSLISAGHNRESDATTHDGNDDARQSAMTQQPTRYNNEPSPGSKIDHDGYSECYSDGEENIYELAHQEARPTHIVPDVVVEPQEPGHKSAITGANGKPDKKRRHQPSIKVSHAVWLAVCLVSAVLQAFRR